jgi:hypothetical protein
MKKDQIKVIQGRVVIRQEITMTSTGLAEPRR